MTDEQVISKSRVESHGEVLTAQREVEAMLDLVRHETYRIDSRFLEPACGTGNFLVEVLRRKLSVVKGRYKRSRLEYERYAAIAISSIYGIDLLKDNVLRTQERLFTHVENDITAQFGSPPRGEYLRAVKYVVSRNIVWGDALTLKSADGTGDAIHFSEWSPVTGSQIKRRDFAFHELLDSNNDGLSSHVSDQGKLSFIPEPIREYPVVQFVRLPNVD